MVEAVSVIEFVNRSLSGVVSMKKYRSVNIPITFL